MKHFLFSNKQWLLGSALTSLALQGAAQAETMEQALMRMLEREPELRAAAWDSTISGYDQKIARSEMLPQVSINGSAGVSERDRSLDGVESGASEELFSRQVGASLQQLLFDFGQAKNRNESAKAQERMQFLLEKGMREGRVVDLIEVYLEVIRTRRQISLAQENVANHQRFAQMLRTKVENGGASADMALVEGRTQLARTSLDTQMLALSDAESRYELLSGQRPTTLVMPATPPLPDSMDQVDLSQNSQYLAAMQGLEMATFGRKATDKEGMPRFFADAGYTAGEDVLGIPGRDNEARAMLRMEWNLIRGGANMALKKRGNALESKAEELVRSADLQRRYNLSLAWNELTGSRNTANYLSQYAGKLEKVGQDYDEQFRLGKRDLLGILDLKQENYSARSRLLDSSFNKTTSLYRILGVQGKLLETVAPGMENGVVTHGSTDELSASGAAGYGAGDAAQSSDGKAVVTGYSY